MYHGQALTFVIFVRWLVDDGAMLEASEIKHSYTTICAAADKHIDAVGAESNIVDFLVVGDQLCLCSQSGNIPNGAGCVNAGSDDQTR